MTVPTLDAPTADDWDQAHADWSDAAPADPLDSPLFAPPTPDEVAAMFEALGEADPFL